MAGSVTHTFVSAKADGTDTTLVRPVDWNAAHTFSGFVEDSDFNAYTILMATSDDTPIALTVGEQTLVGRKTGGAIAALSGADALLAMGITPLVAELNYVDGVTSAIQGQIDAKAPSTAPTFATSITGSYLTASEILITDASKNIVSAAVATYPSLTELAYVKGVTSAIQTQMNLKAPLISPSFTTPTLGVASATSLATSAAIPLLMTYGQLVNISLTSQTVGATTLTIPDFASVVDEFVFKTKAVTMSNKTFVAPALGAATATSINGLIITTTAGTLTIANSASAALVTSGNYSITLTATAATSVTLPTTGTLATLAGTEELDSKTLDSSVGKGTWTASGTWTLPAFTLGGAVTLGGQVFDAGAGKLQINTTGGGDGTGFVIQSTNDGNVGATVMYNHVSASPLADDILFNQFSRGKNSTGGNIDYCIYRQLIEDPTSTSEDGKQQWHNMSAGAANLAMTLSGTGELGVDASGDSGTYANVELFDEYDDALVLREGIQQRNRELLADMGVFTRKDTGSGYMMNVQPMVRLLAGGIYQTRQLLEDTRNELTDRLRLIEQKLTLLTN